MNIQETLAACKQTLASVKILTGIKQPVLAQRKYPIPNKGGRPAKYPWMVLKLDDSFLIPCQPTPKDRARVMNSLTSCISNARKHGRNFVQRSEAKGVRVWRVE